MESTTAGAEYGMKRRLAFLGFFKRLLKEKPLGTAGLAITIAFLMVGILADLLAPYGVNETTLVFLGPPSKEFILGTDNLGRDLLSRIIYGARISVIIGLSATTLATLYSVLIGTISGYIGGRLDMAIQRFVDAWMCLPGLIMSILLISIIGTGMVQTIFVISLILGIGGSRIVRGAVIAIKSNAYIDAASAIGCSRIKILVFHVLPNVMATVVTIFSLRVAEAILIEASLSFLGLGIPPPNPSWGAMLGRSGRDYMFLAPWMVIWPGLAIAIVVYGINMFGDAMRDILDPKLKGGVGRYSGGHKLMKKKKRSKAAL